MSSSPPRDPDQGPGEYEMDSFDVPDNAEIVYSCLVMYDARDGGQPESALKPEVA